MLMVPEADIIISINISCVLFLKWNNGLKKIDQVTQSNYFAQTAINSGCHCLYLHMKCSVNAKMDITSCFCKEYHNTTGFSHFLGEFQAKVEKGFLK